jgi:HNH endonuclease
MLTVSILCHRITEAERYLALVQEDYRGKWELSRHDAEACADVALAFALIHPDNWPGRGDQQRIQGSRAFKTKVIYGTRLCNAVKYWGVTCTADTSTEGAIADHVWPYSLGGPTEVANIMWLCRRHNQIKGADIHFYPWELGWPDWLSVQLEKVRRMAAD